MSQVDGHLGARWEQLDPYERWLQLLIGDPRVRSTDRPLLSRDTAMRLLHRRGITSGIDKHDGLPRAETLFAEYYAAILTQLPLSDWHEVFENGGARHLRLRSGSLRCLRQLADAWTGVLECRHDDAESKLVGFLCDNLTWRRTGTLSLESWDVALVEIGLEFFSLGTQIPLHLTVLHSQDSEALAANEIRYLQQLLAARDRFRLMINVVLGESSQVETYRAELKGVEELIFLNETRLKQIFLSDQFAERMKSVLREDLSLKRINPYSTEKPVSRPNMFFGRQPEIDRIIGHPDQDFMIIGSRQIGKSSLCMRLERMAKSQGDRTPIWVDVSQHQHPETVIQLLATKISPRWSDCTLGTFGQLVRTATRTATSRSNKRYLFLIDEVDPLLQLAEKSADWRLFQVLRELSQAQMAQSIFTGHRVLYEQWRNLRSPLYNFASPIVLSRLDERSTKKLIKEPLDTIGVRFEPSEEKKCIEHIQLQTGGYPSFVQFFCRELVNRIADRQDSSDVKSRLIEWKDVDHVCMLKEYADFVLRPIGLQENLTDLDRLVVFELAVGLGTETRFSMDDLLNVLGRHELPSFTHKLVSSLENLELAGIIARESTSDQPWDKDCVTSLHFRVTVPALPRIVMKVRPVEREIRDLVARLKA